MPPLQVVDCFDKQSGPLSVADLVRLSNLPRSTVFRNLQTLRDQGYVHQDHKTRRYVLGPRMLQLGVRARLDLASELVLGPPLIRLQKRTAETVTFSLLDGATRICVFVLEAHSDLRQVAQVGARYPLNLGAAGKAILAHLGDEIASSILRSAGLDGSRLQRVLLVLERIRKQGYAATTGERVTGASAVAAPVFVSDMVLGSVAVAGPQERMKPAIARLLPPVIAAADELTHVFSSPSLERGVAVVAGDGDAAQRRGLKRRVVRRT